MKLLKSKEDKFRERLKSVKNALAIEASFDRKLAAHDEDKPEVSDLDLDAFSETTAESPANGIYEKVESWEKERRMLHDSAQAARKVILKEGGDVVVRLSGLVKSRHQDLGHAFERAVEDVLSKINKCTGGNITALLPAQEASVPAINELKIAYIEFGGTPSGLFSFSGGLLVLNPNYTASSLSAGIARFEILLEEISKLEARYPQYFQKRSNK